MPPSQLKQLKSQLREKGILGPQKSKKQRQQNPRKEAAIKRNAALHDIRERFNPFETRAPSRPAKFDVASNRPTQAKVERPGVTRGLGEERRRETLLKEVQSRHKVGGMVDRRFGEGDVNVDPEVLAAERFARAASRRMERQSAFNLEDDSGEEMTLTHGGRTLFEDGEAPTVKDDFDESVSGDEDEQDEQDRPKKRPRFETEDADADPDADADETPLRKKTKKEVMEEVIAKSKMYKAMRQQAKEDDDGLRIELDKGMGDFYEALRKGQKPQPRLPPTPPATDSEPAIDPGRAAMIAGKTREDAEKEYEANLRQMKMDARSQPTFRTKTDDEKAAEQKERLEELERDRLRRMRGEESSDDQDQDQDDTGLDPDEQDDADAFGLAQPTPTRPTLDVEDEDEFVFDDIIASDSDPDADLDSSSDTDADASSDGDDDFINGLVLPSQPSTASKPKTVSQSTSNVAYTFPCPTSHAALLELTATTAPSVLPTIIQRIRALYHKSLSPENASKLASFTAVLTQHISYLTTNSLDTPMPIIEQLIRHLHSMAKSQPNEVAAAVRSQLREMSDSRPLNLHAGDLIILTTISTIFPTSDQWHTVVTPAMLTIARYLAHSQIDSLHDLATGAYCCTLALKYQDKSRRYVPEIISYIYKALQLLNAHSKPPQTQLRPPSARPTHAIPRASKFSAQSQPPKLAFSTLRDPSRNPPSPQALLGAFHALTNSASALYAPLSAYPEIIAPLHSFYPDFTPTPTTRKPLLLHTHRPLAIKSALPAFTENYNPDRHHDPDRERAEMKKLQAEHKRERKGAVRELRKDAAFMAREQLREKKARDEAYEKKYKRLVAEIQGEEGREANAYEREREKRRK